MFFRTQQNSIICFRLYLTTSLLVAKYLWSNESCRSFSSSFSFQTLKNKEKNILKTFWTLKFTFKVQILEGKKLSRICFPNTQNQIQKIRKNQISRNNANTYINIIFVCVVCIGLIQTYNFEFFEARSKIKLKKATKTAARPL